MANREHLAALELRLSNERVRLASAKSDQERRLREVWVRQIENEILREKHGSYFDSIENDMSTDELLAALFDD